MKKTVLFLVGIFLIPLLGLSQVDDGYDYISPFNEGVAAVKKASQWAFINEEGVIVIPFRNDIVASKINNSYYPFFNSGLCLITTKKDGVNYFGYIDKTGKTIIEPEFLNAIPFKNNVAIVLHLAKEDLGTNDLLGKNLIGYNYTEVVISNEGEILHHLTKPRRITLSKKHIKTPPVITSKFISDHLIATLNNAKKWEISKLE